MIAITNPFTGQIVNAWTDESRRKAIETRKRKAMEKNKPTGAAAKMIGMARGLRRLKRYEQASKIHGNIVKDVRAMTEKDPDTISDPLMELLRKFHKSKYMKDKAFKRMQKQNYA